MLYKITDHFNFNNELLKKLMFYFITKRLIMFYVNILHDNESLLSETYVTE